MKYQTDNGNSGVTFITENLIWTLFFSILCIHNWHPDPDLECILALLCHIPPPRCSFPDSEAFSEHVEDGGDGLPDHCVSTCLLSRHLLISPSCPWTQFCHNKLVSWNKIFHISNCGVRKSWILFYCISFVITEWSWVLWSKQKHFSFKFRIRS